MSNDQQATQLNPQRAQKESFRWYLLLLFFLISVVLTFLVTHTVARIEDKYFQTHRVFLDPAVYQEHLFKLWQASHQKNRFELAWNELANPPEEGIPPLAFRTIPLLLLNPEWLKNSHAHLITSGFSLFIFLFLLLHTVYRRTNSFLYAMAAAALICVTPGFYGPVFGLGAFWLDLSAGFLGGAAALCLINSEQGRKLLWLAGFAALAASSLFSRFVTGSYLFIQGAPLLAVYFWRRWRQTESFLRGVLAPLLLIGGILFVLTAWYIWRQAPAQSFYYMQESYDYESMIASAQFVFRTILSFLGYNFALICSVIFGCQILFGFRVAWRGLLECVWLVAGTGLILIVACQLAGAPYAVQYIVPILLFALLCPIDWRRPSRSINRRLVTLLVKIPTPLILLIVAGLSLDQTLHSSLWRPPGPTPQEADRKALNDRLTDELTRYFPDKVVGAYFDQFDEYTFVTAFEKYGRPPRLLSGRVFDIRAEYLQARFPRKSPKELADMACREAVEKCDIVLVFNDPAAAFKPAPFDYGWCLNPYSEEIASRLARLVQSDPNWKKLFVAPSRYLPGGVAAYANLTRFPDAIGAATQ
jgi:hypothetical protein